jgi:hypothetical protein
LLRPSINNGNKLFRNNTQGQNLIFAEKEIYETPMTITYNMVDYETGQITPQPVTTNFLAINPDFDKNYLKFLTSKNYRK